MLDNKQDHAKRIISEMFSEFKRLLNPYYLLTIYVMSCNKVERQYKDSFLGTLWSLLQPLSQIVIYALILQQLIAIVELPTKNKGTSLKRCQIITRSLN